MHRRNRIFGVLAAIVLLATACPQPDGQDTSPDESGAGDGIEEYVDEDGDDDTPSDSPAPDQNDACGDGTADNEPCPEDELIPEDDGDEEACTEECEHSLSMVITPYDTSCIFRVTGEDAEGCPDSLSLVVAVNDAGTTDLAVDVADEHLVTWSWAVEADDALRLQEMIERGDHSSYYGEGFEAFSPQGNVPYSADREGGTVWLREWPTSLDQTPTPLSDEPLQIRTMAGSTEGGLTVPASVGDLVNFTVFTSLETPEGEVQGTFGFVIEQFATTIGEMLLEIAGLKEGE